MCIISREFSTHGPGFVSISPDNKIIENVKNCARKFNEIDKTVKNLTFRFNVVNRNDWMKSNKYASLKIVKQVRFKMLRHFV